MEFIKELFYQLHEYIAKYLHEVFGLSCIYTGSQFGAHFGVGFGVGVWCVHAAVRRGLTHRAQLVGSLRLSEHRVN